MRATRTDACAIEERHVGKLIVAAGSFSHGLARRPDRFTHDEESDVSNRVDGTTPPVESRAFVWAIGSTGQLMTCACV